jgi:hypothetical protein
MNKGKNWLKLNISKPMTYAMQYSYIENSTHMKMFLGNKHHYLLTEFKLM